MEREPRQRRSRRAPTIEASDEAGSALARYGRKRNFQATPEPAPVKPGRARRAGPLSFVIQKHWARRLHYDFRLELDGVLMSWAVPKGPCFDPAEKRMAVHVEDHPLDYASFEGAIPAGNYGAGDVVVWDRGTWEPVGDPREGVSQGKLVFRLHGEKLAGLWELVRTPGRDTRQDAWILFKKRDEWSKPLAEYDVISALPDSVIEKPLGLLEDRTKSASAPHGQTPDLSRAVRAAMPVRIEPQLASLATTLPTGNQWLIETKFDGYRLLARIEDERIRLFTRGGEDWTKKFPEIVLELVQIVTASAWLDGEIVVLVDGKPDFGALQKALSARQSGQIVYFVFDLMYLDGLSLRDVPLWARRACLSRLIGDGSDRIRFSEDFQAPAAQLLKAACEIGLEGIMLKDRNSPYTSGRTQTWRKGKCRLRQEFVICGFTTPEAAPRLLSGLIVGYHVDGKLRPAGHVGTGWDVKTANDLHRRLVALEAQASPFETKVPSERRWGTGRRSEHWVKPQLVAEVAFAEWTASGHIRHSSFKGLRTDKPAHAITREAAVTSIPARADAAITHGERVIDPSTGLTKLALVRYYESVADWILPHLKDRPLSLVRAPEGIEGQLFFQKHAEKTAMPALTQHDPSLWPGHGALLTIDSADALFSAAQMNVVEFHTWNSTVANLKLPDRVVFDLDPGEGLPWQRMKEAAFLVRTLLTELGLQAWLKTSGGKGLHVVVPLTPTMNYADVKNFSRAFVQHIAAVIPDRFSSKSGPANRVGKVYVDYLRNGMAQTTAAAFSARARHGLGVSMPISWEQLDSLKSASQWTIANAREYLSFLAADPWRDFALASQTLDVAGRLLSN
ncbi:DNA ligase D [Paraburkholderia youngii]|uniref:DNA ligase D n=1 Tax=Paraburkholderia youngii TaxID=2782701 RepID=UPI003D1F5984